MAAVLVAGLAPAQAGAARKAKKVKLAGVLAERHGDDFARGRMVARGYVLTSGKRTVRLTFEGRAPRALLGERVRVRGTERGNRPVLVTRIHALVAADGDSSLPAGAGSAAETAAATKRVAVILFNFSNNTSQPYTPAHAAGIAFTNTSSVAAYYARSSWGALALTGDVYGWYTIPETNAGCAYTTWASSANKAATAAGVNLAAYDHLVYAFPGTSSCSWTGLAYMPGRQSWLNGGGMRLKTMAHELGHNFGTHHASTLRCTEKGVRVALVLNVAGCTANEYGDPVTVMGSALGYEHSNFSRGNFGWLGTSTATVTSAGDYELAPVGSYAPGAVRALQIPRTSSTFLTLEFRQASSPFDVFSAGDPVVNGVTVRITGTYANRTQSKLVDATPETTSFGDAAIGVGKTLVDPLTGAAITTLAVSPAGATVRVTWAPDEQAPTEPANLRATPLDPYRVSLTWNASSDDRSVAGYRIRRDGALVATVTALTYTDTGLSPSTTYGYEVVAFDAAGNVSPAASASARTLTPDTAPPSAPSGLEATVGKGKKVTLSWTASTDDVGVAGYRIFRNGKQAATTTGTSWSETLGGKSPTATYYVVAYDAAGNVSAASNQVTVRL